MKGTICGFKDPIIGAQLLTMGVTNGSKLIVIGKSPFGSSYHVMIDDRSLAMGLMEINAISLV